MVHLWNDIFLDFLIVNCYQTWPVRNDNEIRYLESISFTCLQRMKPDFCCWKYVWAGVRGGGSSFIFSVRQWLISPDCTFSDGFSSSEYLIKILYNTATVHQQVNIRHLYNYFLIFKQLPAKSSIVISKFIKRKRKEKMLVKVDF